MDMDFRQGWIQALKQGCQVTYTHDLHVQVDFPLNLKNVYSLLMQQASYHS